MPRQDKMKLGKKAQLMHAYVLRQETELALKYRRLEILSQAVSIKIVNLHRHEQMTDGSDVEHRLMSLQNVETALHSSHLAAEEQIKQLKRLQADLNRARNEMIAKV